MKYFRVTDPFSSLIKAHTKESAINLYEKVMDGEKPNRIHEVSRDHALAIYSRAVDGRGKRRPIKPLLSSFNDGEEKVLTIDQDLV